MEYIIGTSSFERRRLEIQAQFFEPFTRRILVSAGVADGMEVLDIGAGSGDVALLAAKLVGSSGRVLGVNQRGIGTRFQRPIGTHPCG